MLDAKKYALIDLHIHLDGSLSLASARALAELQKIEIEASDDALLKMLRVSDGCRDLNEYLEKFALPLSLLQSREAITEATLRLCEELYDEGLIYAEIRFAPQLHTQKGLSQAEVVEAAIEGVRSSRLSASLILCCMRGNDNERENFLTVDVAKRFYGKGVCSVDLAGAEALFPTADFERLFNYARESRLRYTIHAGEADGPSSVYCAIALGASRIGHGVRSIEDEKLIKILAEKKIALELCPTSNLNTRAFEKIEDYPIRKLLDAGVCVTLNTDNTAVSNTSLAKEFQLIADSFKLDEGELEQIARNSLASAFLGEDERARLEVELERRLA